MTAEIHFFIGKGGVGKSTTSALTALQLALSGRQTLLVSMDPAHNLRDIFQRSFSEKPAAVMPNLMVKEVDTDYWMNRYLQEIESQLRRVYRYHSAFNLQGCYSILKYSPGLEEYALLSALTGILKKESSPGDIIFDMPPTALTLRFFSLPFITLIWLAELLKLRNQINAKKEIVSKIRFGKKEIELDRVKARLELLIDHYGRLRDTLTAARTSVNLVVNTDPLSVAEGVRIRRRLSGIGIELRRVVFNRADAEHRQNDFERMFNGYPIVRFPFSADALYGMDALQQYLLNHPPERSPACCQE
jgi:arsenite-transporting ATPase